jgi:hypothetical protein
MAMVREIIRRVLPLKVVQTAVSIADITYVRSPRQYPQRHSGHTAAAPKHTRVGTHPNGYAKEQCRETAWRRGYRRGALPA